MKRSTVHVYKNVDELLRSTADFFIKVAGESILNRGEFTVALSGGNSPKKLYELLTTANYKRQIDWSKVYFFFGDERYVPISDPESNALMAKKALFEPLTILPSNIFTVNTAFAPEEAAKQYDERIRNHFKARPIRFDLILLGLGENAHTASLFPYTTILEEKSASVRAVSVNEISAVRISFTAPLINQAHHIVFLVYGESKALAVKNILMEKKNVERFPAQLIHPDHGDLRWFIDDASASFLK